MACQQRRDANRAGALDDQLGPLEEEHHRLGDLVLADQHDPVDPVADQRQRQLPGTLDGDPVGDRQGRVDRDRLARRERGRERRAGVDLDADHLNFGTLGFDRDRDSADQTAAPDGHDHARQMGNLVQQFEPEPALAGHDARVVERVHERQPALVGAFVGGGERVVDGRPDESHLRAERGGRLDLGDRRRLGHEHLAVDATGPGRVGNRLRVVPGAAGDDAVGALEIIERRDLGERAAELEGASPLQVLGLQRDVGAGPLGERLRAQHRGLADHADRRRGGTPDVAGGRRCERYRLIRQALPPRPSRPERRAAAPQRRPPHAPVGWTRRTTRRPR